MHEDNPTTMLKPDLQSTTTPRKATTYHRNRYKGLQEALGSPCWSSAAWPKPGRTRRGHAGLCWPKALRLSGFGIRALVIRTVGSKGLLHFYRIFLGSWAFK